MGLSGHEDEASVKPISFASCNQRCSPSHGPCHMKGILFVGRDHGSARCRCHSLNGRPLNAHSHGLEAYILAWRYSKEPSLPAWALAIVVAREQPKDITPVDASMGHGCLGLDTFPVWPLVKDALARRILEHDEKRNSARNVLFQLPGEFTLPRFLHGALADCLERSP